MVTAAHVVDGVSRVHLVVGQHTWTAGVVRTLPARDLALLSVTGARFPPLRLWRGEAPVGEQVFATGAALGQLSVSRGIVSGTRRLEGLEYLQTDAAVNPGNSGGPLLDESGRVLGLVVSKLRRAEGISLAVPADEVRDFVAGAREGNGTSSTAGVTDSRSRDAVTGDGSATTSPWWLAVPAVAVLALIGSRAASLRGRRTAPPIVITEAELATAPPLPTEPHAQLHIATQEKEQQP